MVIGMTQYAGWILLVAAILAVFAFARLRGRISPGEAARLLSEEGAVIVDVRTEGEYQAGHAPGALNLPLDRFGEALPEAVPDTATPLLLHCHSGTRSAVAVGVAKRKGYSRVFNLGTVGRARAASPDGAPG